MGLNIEDLEVKISANGKAAANSINALVGAVKELKGAFSGLNSASDSVKRLGDAIKALNDSAGNSKAASANIKALADSMTKMTGAASAAGSVSLLATAISKFQSIGDTADIMKNITSSMKKLGEGVKNLDDLVNSAEHLAESTNRINLLADAVRNLANASSELKGTSSAFREIKKISTDSGQTVVKQNQNVAQSTKQASSSVMELGTVLADSFSGSMGAISSFGNMATRVFNTIKTTISGAIKGIISSITALIATTKKAYSVIKGFVDKSNKYVEDFNLFTVSLGEYADQAQEYANRVSEIMGIDPAAWMRNQGVFNTIIKGFGVATDRAYTMSQQLTQLGYDISSFYNIDVEEAMTKLTSGISGELEPLRRLGYDLSVARLEQDKTKVTFSDAKGVVEDLTIALDDAALAQEALNRGITKSVSDMTQAEKAQLRYFSIMTQVTDAQGDMSRTLSAPANQLRVLSAQFDMLGREIGNIFIPALNAALPYIIATTKALRDLASWLAELAGYEMPEIDYSGSNTVAQIEDIEDAWDGASKKAKEFKKFLLGIDELNIVPTTNGSGRGYGDENTEGWRDFDLPTYDFIGNAAQNRVNDIYEKIKEAFTGKNPKQMGESISQWIIDGTNSIDWSTIKQNVSTISSGFAELLNGLFTPDTLGSVGSMVGNFFDSVLLSISEFTANADFEQYGKSIMSFFTGIVNSITPENLVGATMGLINGLEKFLFGLWEGWTNETGIAVGKLLGKCLKELFSNDKWGNMIKSWGKDILTVITTSVKGWFDVILGIGKLELKRIDVVLTNLFGNVWINIKNAAIPKIQSIGQHISAFAQNIVTWFQPVIDIFSTLGEAISNFATETGGIFSALGTGTWYSALEGLESLLRKKNNTPSFATGGFPEDGLFFANHGEMIGQFSNGRTAVANNDQIVAGISEGVRGAVLSALSSSGIVEAVMSGKSINIDGREIMNVVVNQNNRAINRTGVSPIRT